MDRLSPLSAAFLTAEDADPECTMVIGSCAVLDGPAPSLVRLRALVEDRLHLAPRYRQRVRRAPWDLRAPAWVDDPGFDLHRHVVARGLPRPGTDQELAELVASVMSERMDRSAPLWDLTLVEPLEGGRWALVCRVHHALADGVSGTELLDVVFDRAPAGPAPAGPGPSPRAGLARLLGDGLTAVRGGVGLSAALAPVHGPSVLGTVRGGTRYAWRTVATEPVRALRRSVGATLNDVALAAVAGGFRVLLEHRGLEAHPRALRSLVPVSTWTEPDAAHPDNRVTLVLADLPVDVAADVARVRAVHARMRRLRGSGEPEAGVWAQRLLAAVPFAVVSRATRLLMRLPQHQVATVTTNVPGPRTPVRCLGRRVELFLPYVPIADRVQLGVAMFSYCGTLTFGFTADRDVDDLDVLANAVAASWNALAGPSNLCDGDV